MPFIRSAILPEWWDDDCAHDQALVPDIEIRVARFLGVPLSVVKDPRAPLAPPTYVGAQLRRVRAVNSDRLTPAIHSALQIGAAVIRSMRAPVPSPVTPPAEASLWREQLQAEGRSVTLDDLLGDLWKRGVPVVPIDVLPIPSFQGMACIIEGRPVVLLGHRHDEPARVAYFVAHEVGHIAAGDCSPDRPVVDEEDQILDDDDLELRADGYATRMLIGADTFPQVDGTTFKKLASCAVEVERARGSDAATVIFAWAARTGDYPMATMAVKALYRATGARRQLRAHFDRHIDTDGASESDRALLRCVYGEPNRDETSV